MMPVGRATVSPRAGSAASFGRSEGDATRPEPAAIEASYPLAPLQQGMISSVLAEPDAGFDVLQIVFALRERVDAGVLGRAWQRVVDRHAILRTAFRWTGVSAPLQDVHRHVSMPIAREDWGGLSEAEQASRLDRFLAEDRARGIDLARAPLMRLVLFRLGDADYRLVWTVPHALLDGRSILSLIREIFALYDAGCGPGTPVSPAPRPFADHIAWLGQRDRADSEAFWRGVLDGVGASPPRLPRSPASEAGGARYGSHTVHLPADATRAIHELAERIGVTPYIVLEGAWALLLGGYTGSRDVVFGTTRACRHSGVEGAEEMIGLLINTVPVRTRLPADQRRADWLRELRARSIAVRPHEHTSLSAIQQWAGLPPGGALFESLVVYEKHVMNDVLRAQGGAWEHREMRILRQPSAPLALAGFGGTELKLELLHDRTHFGDALIRRMMRHLVQLLEDLVRDPGRRVGGVELLRGAERERVLVEWNATEAPAGSPVLELISAQARRAPEAPAVASHGEQLSYGELERRSNQLAHHLRGRGVGPEVRVGVCLERSPELVVALLGVLKAGGAYVPLDPDYPAERLAHVLADARAPLVLTRSTMRERLAAAGAALVCLDEARERIDAEPEDSLAVEAGPESLAYVIYTSGSTGAPKGVMCTHAGLANLVEWHRRTFDVGPQDRATLLASVGFDASAWEVWPYLCAGASLHVVPEETRTDPALLAGWLDREAITLGFVPTPLTEALLREPRLPRGMRYLLTGGDQLHAGPPVDAPFTLINNYGPTESTVVATSGPVPPVQTASAPDLGRPIANTRAYVLDAGGRPAPVDAWGELYLGGTGLARGYLGRAGETASRFVPDPFSGTAGARLYRTGDRVRWRDGGVLEFGGRVDEQVKIRGFRIEPGEVEAVLRTQPGVRECVVVAREDGGERRLVGYVAAGPEVDPEALRSAARERLPAYMVPAAVVRLEQIPRTPHGKLDRRALPAPGPAGEAAGHVAPRTPVEAALAGIWAEVLSVPRVGIHDDFFAFGGDSLRAAQAAARVREALGTPFSAGTLFDHPTVASAAARVVPASAPIDVISPPRPGPTDALVRLVGDLSDDEVVAALEILIDTGAA